MLRIFFVFIVMLISCKGIAQGHFNFDQMNLTDSQSAFYKKLKARTYTELELRESGNNLGKLNGRVVQFRNRKVYSTSLFDNNICIESISYYRNGKISSILRYKENELDGFAMYYSKTGQLLIIALFKNGVFKNVIFYRNVRVLKKILKNIDVFHP